ncbi:MAG TPA: LPD29 domain-containing protein [Rummeliibacillus sp.]|nr:LPD29 domain-containing protein [Rummeliibacillus sp.]
MAIGRMIKAELKKAFPSAKFSVTSDCNSVRITWVNGPSHKKVDEITSKYKMGNFDGMTDSYDYSNRREDIPQVSYVFLNREISEDVYASKFKEYKAYYLSWENLKDMNDTSVPMEGYSPRGFIRHELSEVCL